MTGALGAAGSGVLARCSCGAGVRRGRGVAFGVAAEECFVDLGCGVAVGARLEATGAGSGFCSAAGLGFGRGVAVGADAVVPDCLGSGGEIVFVSGAPAPLDASGIGASAGAGRAGDGFSSLGCSSLVGTEARSPCDIMKRRSAILSQDGRDVTRTTVVLPRKELMYSIRVLSLLESRPWLALSKSTTFGSSIIARMTVIRCTKPAGNTPPAPSPTWVP